MPGPSAVGSDVTLGRRRKCSRAQSFDFPPNSLAKSFSSGNQTAPTHIEEKFPVLRVFF